MNRAFAAIALAFVAAPALAASPEADYLAARDKGIAGVAKMEGANVKFEKIDAAQKTYLADLNKRLSLIVGPVDVEGFPKTGKINFDTLSKDDVGFGGLDALSFAEGDGEKRLIVTSRGLLDAWLKARAAEKDAALKLPADEKAAFALDDFFTFAIGEDASFAAIADIPLVAPAGADVAVARLGGWAQDIGPNPHLQIEIVLVKNGRVLIADTPAKSPVPKIAECEQIWTAADAAWDKFMKAYGQAKTKDEKAFDAASATHDKGYDNYRACLIKSLPKAPGFDAVVAEAQGYADRIAK